jgi:RNA polymerase sigma factor (sigma-70 family)
MRAIPNPLLRYLSGVAPCPTSATTDAERLSRFVSERDETAFAVLIARHRPMVLRVCRRVLGNAQDAEDAFQATFLVLARKAGEIRRRNQLAAWLHGTAYRLALKARVAQARRRRGEVSALVPAPPDPQPDPLSRMTARELLTALDEELRRLPEVHRLPLVLCCLEGRTQAEAARLLGWTPGMVRGRLERGRARLHARMARRGLTLPAALLALDALHGPTAAGVPGARLISTVQAALRFAAGAGNAGRGGSQAITLAEEALKAMLLTKLKIATAVLVTLVVVAVGAGLWRLTAPAAEPPKSGAVISKDGAGPKPAKPVVVRQDAILAQMGMSADGEAMATVGLTHDGLLFNSTVKFWDTRTGTLKRAMAEEKDSYLEIAFSPDLLAIGVNSRLHDPRGPREVRLLDAKTLKLKHKIDKTLVPGVFSWSALAFSPDSKRLAVAGRFDNNGFAPPFVKLWNVEQKQFIAGKADLETIPGGRNVVRSLAFSPDGTLVAASWFDGTIRLFDGRTGDFKTLLDPELKPAEAYHGASGLAFSPDSKTLASNGADNTVALWDLTEGKPPRGERPDEKKLEQLIANLDDDRFATRQEASKDLEKLGKSAEGAMRKALAAGGLSLEAKRRLERLLEKAGKAERRTLKGHGRTLKGHKGPVEGIAFSKDGRWIATSGRAAKEGAYEVILWDARTGKVKQTFAGLTDQVRAVAFSPDGKTLAVCGGAGRRSPEGKGRLKTSGALTLFRLE